MFEATILLALLGLILWFVLAKEQPSSARRTYGNNLVAELRPSTKKRVQNGCQNKASA